MRGGAGAWKTLEIARTDDAREIRKAYAKKLKATDVEADPAAFIALREALDQALAYAAGARRRAEARLASDAAPDAALTSLPLVPPVLDAPAAPCTLTVGLGEPSPAPAPLRDVGPATGVGGADLVTSPELSARFDPRAIALADAAGAGDAVAALAPPDPAQEAAAAQQRSRPFERLEALLFPSAEDEPLPDPGELNALGERILSDPEMARLDYAARVEEWLADVLAAAIPRSDNLLDLVVGHFGWDRHYGKWDQAPNVDYVVERWRGLMFLSHVSQPGHEYYKAWRELTRGEGDTLGWNCFLLESRVQRFLRAVREKYPEAENGLDPFRVALWDERLGNDDQHEALLTPAWGLALFFFPPAVTYYVFKRRAALTIRILAVGWTLFWLANIVA